MRVRPSAASGAAVALLLGALALQAWPCLRLWSATFDEPAHIAAGMSYLKTGEFKINLQHPPLLKEIAAVPLVATGTQWPVSEAAWNGIGSDPDPFLQWEIGRDVLYRNDPREVLFWSRLPFLGLTLLLVWAIFAWGREMLGPWPAVIAAALCALDPSIVAHGILVATDTGFALFTVLFAWALWRHLNHRSLRRLLLCGLALGGALASKFSGVLLLPVLLLLLILAARFIPAAMPRQTSTPVDPYAGEGGASRILCCLLLMLAIAGTAAAVVQLLYFLPRDPFLYLRGVALVNADHDPTYRPYMAGSFQPRFFTYYAVAYLLKEPLPSILLAGAGLIVMVRRDRQVPALDAAFLLVPPAALFLFYTLVSHNLGFRYIIPALPFLHLLGGVGAHALWRSGGLLKRAAVAGLLVWLGVTAVAIHPDALSYFNETACLLAAPERVGLDGGSACGPLWLDDSNVDWGQGLNQLKTWVDTNAPGRTIGLAYFGTAIPERHGLTYTRVTGRDLETGLPPGLHAVSAHLLARAIGRLDARVGRGERNWIRQTPPRAVVGHAFYIYEIGAGSGG